MTIAERCYQLAEQAKTSAKSMHCRANADARAAALKAANVYVMAAGWSETMSLTDLAERCRTQAAAYMASGKAYKPGPKKSEYIRGASVLREVAGWAETEETQGQSITLEEIHEAPPEEAVAVWIGDIQDQEAAPEMFPKPRRPYTRKTPPAQDAAEE